MRFFSHGFIYLVILGCSIRTHRAEMDYEGGKVFRVNDFVVEEPFLPLTEWTSMSWEEQLASLIQLSTGIVRDCPEPRACFHELAKPRAVDRPNRRLGSLLRQFRSLNSARRKSQSLDLLAKFSCERATEAYAMALSLESDLPSPEALKDLLALHHQVATCSQNQVLNAADASVSEPSAGGSLLVDESESLSSEPSPANATTQASVAVGSATFVNSDLIEASRLRLASFYLIERQCDKVKEQTQALRSLGKSELSDRLHYLDLVCDGDFARAPEPLRRWGPYGAHFANEKQPLVISSQKNSSWHLQGVSRFEEWNTLLATILKHLKQGERAIAVELLQSVNLEALARKEEPFPLGFQTAFAAAAHLANQDLLAFQVINRILWEAPAMAEVAVLPLLFPLRYWEQINSELPKDLDPILVLSLIRQESAFNPRAKSVVGARGLMQIMPSTGRRLGAKRADDLWNAEVNIRLGSRYLQSLIRDFGSVELGLAAYNAGSARVREWQKRYGRLEPQLFVEIIPFRETREYVHIVMRNYKIYQKMLSRQALDQGKLAHL
jgi:soluble lytic murein transglycosylase-like protein